MKVMTLSDKNVICSSRYFKIYFITERRYLERELQTT